MKGNPTGREFSRLREELAREEMLQSLSDVEARFPVAPLRLDGTKDLMHLAAALASWIDAADAACGAHRVADEHAWASERLTRFSDGQREWIEVIHTLARDAEAAESEEDLAQINDRAREAVGFAVRLQTRKQRFVSQVRNRELGEDD